MIPYLQEDLPMSCHFLITTSSLAVDIVIYLHIIVTGMAAIFILIAIRIILIFHLDIATAIIISSLIVSSAPEVIEHPRLHPPYELNQ
jgi:hypothetical protein